MVYPTKKNQKGNHVKNIHEKKRIFCHGCEIVENTPFFLDIIMLHFDEIFLFKKISPFLFLRKVQNILIMATPKIKDFYNVLVVK